MNLTMHENTHSEPISNSLTSLTTFCMQLEHT